MHPDFWHQRWHDNRIGFHQAEVTPLLQAHWDAIDAPAGCTVFVPESRFHSTLNTGTAPMQLFVVYSPAGPELVLRELPDFRIIPRGQ